jgi:hypothetical protein
VETSPRPPGSIAALLEEGARARAETHRKVASLVEEVEREWGPVFDRIVAGLWGAYKSLRGDLAALRDAARGLIGRDLALKLMPDAPDDLWVRGGPRMVKFGLPAVLTCPGADYCARTCYATHGFYVQPAIRRALLRSYKFAQKILTGVAKRAREEGHPEPEVAAVSCLGAALAAAAERATGGAPAIVRLHDSGDIYSAEYLAAWLVAAHLLPNYRIYTYTKTLPVETAAVPGAALPGFRRLWERALELYKRATGRRELPANFAVNISASMVNYAVVPEAARAFARLGVRVPAVFFYADADIERFFRSEEDWRALAEALLDAAASTAGRTLVLEIEHGVSARRTMKSAELLERLLQHIIERARSAGVGLKVVVPYRKVYTGYALPDEVAVTLNLALGGQAGDLPLEIAKWLGLREMADRLRQAFPAWTEADEVQEHVSVRVPGRGQIEVFVEPAGQKACNICMRCVMPRAETSPVGSRHAAVAAVVPPLPLPTQPPARRRRRGVEERVPA